MGIWKINIERNYCVIAYAMPTHSVHSPIPFKGIPEPPLEVACLHASFFDGLRSGIKTEFMPKVQAVTAMTLDGFLPETDNVLTQWAMNHKKGFVQWRERCNARILPHYILDLLCEKDTKGDSFIYLAEVSDAETLDLLRGLFHYNLVEELIIYLFPYSAGKGNSIQAIFPVRQWQLHKAVVLPGGICRLIYRNPCRM